MGRAKKDSPEQIENLLWQIEVGIVNGKTHPVACREAGITEQMIYRWRKKYGGLKADQAKRLKELEQENSKLNRPMTNSGLGTEMLVLSKAALHELSRLHKTSGEYHVRVMCVFWRVSLL